MADFRYVYIVDCMTEDLGSCYDLNHTSHVLEDEKDAKEIIREYANSYGVMEDDIEDYGFSIYKENDVRVECFVSKVVIDVEKLEKVI